MSDRMRRWARREWRAFKYDMRPDRILTRFLLGHPLNHPAWLRRLQAGPILGRRTTRGTRP